METLICNAVACYNVTRLSKDLIDKIAVLAGRGWSPEAICIKYVISESAFRNWGKWGWEILEENENDEELAIRSVEEDASRRDRQMMKLYVKFVCTVQEAIGQQVGEIEEVAYAGAMSDPKAAMQWLGIRHSAAWQKKEAPAVVIETHPIKQIIIHEPMQLEEGNTTEAEYIDV
jgi:hypothetical protein